MLRVQSSYLRLTFRSLLGSFIVLLMGVLGDHRCLDEVAMGQELPPIVSPGEKRWETYAYVLDVATNSRNLVRELLVPFQKSRYGLACLELEKETANEFKLPDRVVIVIGGLQSSCETSKAFGLELHQHLGAGEKEKGAERVQPSLGDERKSNAKQQELAVVVFDYPNDGSIEGSGNELRGMLETLFRLSPSTKVAIVSHSMGGLISRWAIEQDPQRPLPNVDRLIMVCPPNHGSVLARYADGLEFFDAAKRLSTSSGSLVQTVRELLDDGLGEACEELVPGSAFLNKINKLPRVPSVRYTVIAGTKAPLNPLLKSLAVESARIAIRRSADQDRLVVASLMERVAELIDSDEFTNGKGDGAVAVESAYLEGVEDFQVIPIGHGDWSDALADNARLVRIVCEKLQSLEVDSLHKP